MWKKISPRTFASGVIPILTLILLANNNGFLSQFVRMNAAALSLECSGDTDLYGLFVWGIFLTLSGITGFVTWKAFELW